MPDRNYAALPDYLTLGPGEMTRDLVVIPLNGPEGDGDTQVILTLATNAYCMTGTPNTATVDMTVAWGVKI